MTLEAKELVREADAILGGVLRPGVHPRRSTIARFESSGGLERVLSLYLYAMRLDPEEPSYPWNLATSMARLGHYHLALAFIEKAIAVANATDDPEWADVYAHIAWAVVAMRAEQWQVALIALATASRLATDDETTRDVARLKAKIAERSSRTPNGNAHLLNELASLIA